MLSTRKIGQVYYVRGTIRVGNKTIHVAERSTGFRKASDAKEYVSCLEKEIVDSVLHPNIERNKRIKFDDCLKTYLNFRNVPKCQFYLLEALIKHFEGCPVSDLQEKWNSFCELKKGIKKNTLNRYASQMNAIMNLAKSELKIDPYIIKRANVKDAVVFLLDSGVKEKLLSCYSNRIRPIFIVLAYQGLREQECLQLLWEDIDLKNKIIIIRTSKNGETRAIPMHKKVWWALSRHWIKQKKPTTGHVWLTMYNKPYRDGRKLGGGGTLTDVHQTALKKLKKIYNIDIKMRIHDWRHDWAGRMVMAGVDLLTVQKLGGWKSVQMVQRYATFSAKHEQDSINKI